jgi:hypothetical protein
VSAGLFLAGTTAFNTLDLHSMDEIKRKRLIVRASVFLSANAVMYLCLIDQGFFRVENGGPPYVISGFLSIALFHVSRFIADRILG